VWRYEELQVEPTVIIIGGVLSACQAAKKGILLRKKADAGAFPVFF